MQTIEVSVTKMEKVNKTNNELGKSHADIRTAQSGKLGSTDDTKWQISVSPTSRWANRFIIAAIVQGALAAAVTALFYQHLEVNLRAPYKGWPNALAGLHLVLMNVGVVGATWLMMNGGYRGGALTITLEAQNPTWSIGQVLGQVHVQVLSGYPSYIAPFVALAIVGAFAGGLGFVAVWRRALKKTPATTS